MPTENDAKSIVKRNRGGEIEGCYGPSEIADKQIWEVWVHTGKEYATRFVVSEAEAQPTYHGSFGELCVYLSRVYQAQEERMLKLAPRSHISKVQLYVAAIVFLCSVAVLLYLVVTGVSPNVATFALFSSLIASGATLFYGVWKQARG